MKEVLKMIDLEKENLTKSDFIEWLKEGEIDSDDRFSFVPSQAFLVMGFQDILNFIYQKSPTSSVEKVLNQHCLEDTNHWIWYLSDLEKLGFNLQSWGGNYQNILTHLWSEETLPLRSIVYDSIGFIRRWKDPYISLVVIEVLEAVFEVFIQGIRGVVFKNNLFEKLDYYGRVHTEKEEGHTLWTEDTDLKDFKVENLKLNSLQKEQALEINKVLFGHFECIFECWYKKRKDFFAYPRNISFTERERAPSPFSQSILIQ